MNNKLKNIIVIKGIIKNLSPLAIGKGKGDLIDIEILKEEDGTPYIPATSLVGALKHHIEKQYNIYDKNKCRNKELWEYLWGSPEMQSHFYIRDLKLIKKTSENVIAVRDGIKIDNYKGITEEKAKYNYEIVNMICDFGFYGEIKIFGDCDLEYTFKLIRTIINVLEGGNFSVGAMTSNGFGRVKLEQTRVHLFEFPKDGEQYLNWLESGSAKNIHNYDITSIKELDQKNLKQFIIEADFEIKDSLIIGSYSTNSNDPDKINIRFNKNPVISGTSLKGAIRSRAERIVNTFGNNSEVILKKTFGWVDEKGKNKEKYKSRVIVEEVPVSNTIEKVQTRIKIDRFTGGVMQHALLEVKPLWHDGESMTLKITLEKYEEWEAGLLLLVLKDLWTSDLPIGGEKAIGRGILKGKRARIKFNGKEVQIKEINGKLDINDESRKLLEDLISKFLEKMGV